MRCFLISGVGCRRLCRLYSTNVEVTVKAWFHAVAFQAESVLRPLGLGRGFQAPKMLRLTWHPLCQQVKSNTTQSASRINSLLSVHQSDQTTFGVLKALLLHLSDNVGAQNLLPHLHPPQGFGFSFSFQHVAAQPHLAGVRATTHAHGQPSWGREESHTLIEKNAVPKDQNTPDFMNSPPS